MIRDLMFGLLDRPKMLTLGLFLFICSPILPVTAGKCTELVRAVLKGG